MIEGPPDPAIPRGGLRLRFWNEGDGTGQLFAKAGAEGFAGESAAYFSVDELRDFAEALKAFPLPERDERRSISGGFGKTQTSDFQEHLGISVYPIGARGHIGIQVRMATELWPETRPESRKGAVLEVITTYEPLGKFANDLLAVLRGSLKEAFVEAHRF